MEHYPAAMTTAGVAAAIFAICRCKQQYDYSEIGRLNEDEIRMPAVAGVLFKWPLIPLTKLCRKLSSELRPET
jgi:hypothetical protein